MTAILLGLFGSFGPYLLAIVGALGVYFFGKSHGATKANNENEKANLNAELERVKANAEATQKASDNSKTVVDDVGRLDDSAVDKQLHDKWNG